ncbi:hypothetical protein UFOVP175_2 [uncultured Caudovirales phage]|uniref:Uncharacterized protein n=1 Tax=uncultured Caudovirales phage TaxID=2100421 RepID=A0A6J7WB02_9CAUD|nr:hypothetical protein UFOVP175_2 [uncultured Caudovirales phage]
MSRLGLGLGLGQPHRLGAGGIPPDPPIERRDILCENGDYLVQENGGHLVITFGTFDSLLTEAGDFLVQENGGKIVLAIY